MNQPDALPAEPPRWTIERADTFLRALRHSRNVAAAARAAGMSRQAAYRLRRRLKGHPFDRAWAEAMRPRRAWQMMVEGYTGSQLVTPGDGR